MRAHVEVVAPLQVFAKCLLLMSLAGHFTFRNIIDVTTESFAMATATSLEVTRISEARG